MGQNSRRKGQFHGRQTSHKGKYTYRYHVSGRHVTKNYVTQRQQAYGQRVYSSLRDYRGKRPTFDPDSGRFSYSRPDYRRASYEVQWTSNQVGIPRLPAISDWNRLWFPRGYGMMPTGNLPFTHPNELYAWNPHSPESMKYETRQRQRDAGATHVDEENEQRFTPSIKNQVFYETWREPYKLRYNIPFSRWPSNLGDVRFIGEPRQTTPRPGPADIVRRTLDVPKDWFPKEPTPTQQQEKSKGGCYHYKYDEISHTWKKVPCSQRRSFSSYPQIRAQNGYRKTRRQYRPNRSGRKHHRYNRSPRGFRHARPYNYFRWY